MRRIVSQVSAQASVFSAAALSTRAFHPTPRVQAPKSFQAFSESDEMELVKVLSTQPKHVARRVRLMAQSNKRKVAQFRNTVTYLMILLQSKLQKKEISPEDASIVLEGVLKECTQLKQSDMSHLLFRASLRFRKYGLQISHASLRHLFNAYRTSGARDLLKTLADEMKTIAGVEPLAMVAYAYAALPEQALQMKESLGDKLTAEDLAALVRGFLSVDAQQAAVDVTMEALELDAEVATVVVSAALAGLEPDRSTSRQEHFTNIYGISRQKGIQLTDNALRMVIKQRLRSASSMNEVYDVERDIKLEQGLDELGMGASSLVIVKLADLVLRGVATSDDAMYTKVAHLQDIIETQAKNDSFDDIDHTHLFSLVRGYGILGKVDEMTKIAAFIKENSGDSMDPRLYDELLRWHAHHQNVKEALAVKEEMEAKKIPHTPRTYYNIFNVLHKFYPHLIKKYYDEMRSHGVNIDAALYARLLKTFSELDEVEFAAHLYREMKAKELQGAVTFHAKAIQPLLKIFKNDKNKIEEIIADAGRRGFLTIPSVQAAILRHHSITKNTAEISKLVASVPGKSSMLFCAVLNHHAKSNNKEAFIETLTELKDTGIALNSQVYLITLRAFSKWRDDENMRRSLDEARASNIVHDDKFLVAVAQSFSSLGDIEAMDKTWIELRDSTLPISMQSYNSLLNLFLLRNNFDRVQEVLAHMMERIPANPVTTTTVIDMLGKMGKLNEMETLLDEMSKSKDVAPTAVTYHQAMAAFAKHGDIAKMEEIRARMVAVGIAETQLTYNILFDGYGRAKRYEHIHELLHERRSKGIEMDEAGYVNLLNIFGRARMSVEVAELVENIHKDKIVLDGKLVSTLATSFSFLGDEAKVDYYATQVLNDPASRMHDIENIFLIYSRMRNTTKLRELLSTQSTPTEFIYNTCVSAFAKAGDHGAVADLLQQMDDQKMSLSANTSITLSSLLLKAGKVDLAQAVLRWRRRGEKVEHGSDDEDRMVQEQSATDTQLQEELQKTMPQEVATDDDAKTSEA